MNEIKLKVMEALQEEAYKGIVRIDSQTMKELNVHPGDVLEIQGSRLTVGIVDRAYPSDIGQSLIRMDGILRKNAKTGIGEIVKVIKADIKEAKSIVEFPQNIALNVDGELRYFQLVRYAGPEYGQIGEGISQPIARGTFAQYIEVDVMGSSAQTPIGFIFGNRDTNKKVKEGVGEGLQRKALDMRRERNWKPLTHSEKPIEIDVEKRLKRRERSKRLVKESPETLVELNLIKEEDLNK